MAGPDSTADPQTTDGHVRPGWSDGPIARALIDITDPGWPVIVDMNLAAELSGRDLGFERGTVIDPMAVTDPETLAESAANFDRLRAGEIDAYDTFSEFTDSTGAVVPLHLTLRHATGPEVGHTYLELAWREAGMPSAEELDPDEEVLDVAQLITTGALSDAPFGVALIDASRNLYVTVNHAYAAALGLERHDLVDRGTEFGLTPDTPMADNVNDVLAVVRGTLASLTLTLPVPEEPEVVHTATLHAIGARQRHARYLVFCLLSRPQTADDTDPRPLPHPLLPARMAPDLYSRAVVDADWRLRLIEPPLSTWGVERDRVEGRSVLPNVDPADWPTLLAAADLVRSGQSPSAVTRVHYRVTTPEPGHYSTECEITREAGLPDGWLILNNRLIGTGGRAVPVADRLRAITLAALNEDVSGVQSSHSAQTLAGVVAEQHGFTPREREILALIIDGGRVSTIAKSLHLSEGTVRNYLSAIFHKVGVRNQAALIEFARTVSTSLTRRRSDR